MNNLEWYVTEEGFTAKEKPFTYNVYHSRDSVVLEIWKGSSLRVLHRYVTEDAACLFAERHSFEQHENRVDDIQSVIGIIIITICCIALYSCQ